MGKKTTSKQQSYIAAGLMSGTSLDGLDMALCRFFLSANEWQMEIIKTETLSYAGTEWKERLAVSMELSGLGLMELHRDFGRFAGRSVKLFLEDIDEKPDLIASHGHTVFHQPDKGLTLQIGDGAEIAAVTGITTVSDFRRLDVALGGQGAPLVPAGDELLFGQYSYCLNLGGFANISFRESNKRIAFDICPVNIVLNALAGYAGRNYDHDGELARKGVVDPELLDALENLDYYRLSGPRSLGKEWVDQVFMPVLEKRDAAIEDKLRTVCEHIALRVAAGASKNPPHRSIINEKEGSSLTGEGTGNINPDKDSRRYEQNSEFLGPGNDGPATMLITGGGARNSFLTRLISEKAESLYTVIPEEELVDFKEAAVFAFLGVLKIRDEVNCLCSVTGAKKDNSGGIIHYP